MADLAITVTDDWQGLGIGSVLARELVAGAPDVREIRTVVAAGNVASLRMLHRLGETVVSCTGGECEVTVRLPAADDRGADRSLTGARSR